MIQTFRVSFSLRVLVSLFSGSATCSGKWLWRRVSIGDVSDGCYRMPLLVSYGRRPAALFSTALCIASNIWRAVSPSYGSFMGACVLNGFAAGPAEVWLLSPSEKHINLCDRLFHPRLSRTLCSFIKEELTRHCTSVSTLGVSW